MPIFRLNDKFINKTKLNRIYKLATPIIGLTGGIATGKSTVSKKLQERGFDVIDADKLVKKIYNVQESIDFIKKLSPNIVLNNEIMFPKLRELFFNNSEIKQEIETFIYPRLRDAFMVEYEKAKHQFIFYDAPILFERELDKIVDLTVLVYAPKDIQIQRLILRDNISKDLANKILSSQLDIEEKFKKANFVINNIDRLSELDNNIDSFLSQIISKD